jgi:hypothetical protein
MPRSVAATAAGGWGWRCIHGRREAGWRERPLRREANAQPARARRSCAGDNHRIAEVRGAALHNALRASRRRQPPVPAPAARGPSLRSSARGWGCARGGGRRGHDVHRAGRSITHHGAVVRNAGRPRHRDADAPPDASRPSRRPRSRTATSEPTPGVRVQPAHAPRLSNDRRVSNFTSAKRACLGVTRTVGARPLHRDGDPPPARPWRSWAGRYFRLGWHDALRAPDAGRPVPAPVARRSVAATAGGRMGMRAARRALHPLVCAGLADGSHSMAP